MWIWWYRPLTVKKGKKLLQSAQVHQGLFFLAEWCKSACQCKLRARLSGFWQWFAFIQNKKNTIHAGKHECFKRLTAAPRWALWPSRRAAGCTRPGCIAPLQTQPGASLFHTRCPYTGRRERYVWGNHKDTIHARWGVFWLFFYLLDIEVLLNRRLGASSAVEGLTVSGRREHGEQQLPWKNSSWGKPQNNSDSSVTVLERTCPRILRYSRLYIYTYIYINICIYI